MHEHHLMLATLVTLGWDMNEWTDMCCNVRSSVHPATIFCPQVLVLWPIKVDDYTDDGRRDTHRQRWRDALGVEPPAIEPFRVIGQTRPAPHSNLNWKVPFPLHSRGFVGRAAAGVKQVHILPCLTSFVVIRFEYEYLFPHLSLGPGQRDGQGIDSYWALTS